MSSLPVLLNLIEELDNPLFYGNDFGLGLHPHHIHHRHNHRHQNQPVTSGLVGLPLGLLNKRQLSRHGEPKGEGKLMPVGKDGFQVCMDVGHFKPSELAVKVVDNCVIVEGRHEEREDDHGYISRHFVRRYSLPKDYDAAKVVSTLSSDGVLTVSAPKPQVEDKSNERIVQIQQTGPAHLNVKENVQEKVGDANGDSGDKK